MHEYGLTKGIVFIANAVAEANHARHVAAVFLAIGENTSFLPESVQLYFDIIAKGTPAEGARLRVRSVKAEMYCSHCHENFLRPPFSFACPVCGELGSPTDIGSECYVERVLLALDEQAWA